MHGLKLFRFAADLQEEYRRKWGEGVFSLVLNTIRPRLNVIHLKPGAIVVPGLAGANLRVGCI
jgi:hypothetical protein